MKTKKVNLTEIIDYTAHACQQPRPVTNSACQVMLEHIGEHLSRGNTVQIQGFGSLAVTENANGNVVHFKPSKKILEHEVPDDPNWPFGQWTKKGAGQ